LDTQEPEDFTLVMACQNQHRRGAQLRRQPFQKPRRDLHCLDGMYVPESRAFFACAPANRGACVEHGPLAKCADEPSAIGRRGEVASAGLDRGEPNRLKEVFGFRPAASGPLSFPEELAKYAWGHVAFRISSKMRCHPWKVIR